LTELRAPPAGYSDERQINGPFKMGSAAICHKSTIGRTRSQAQQEEDMNRTLSFATGIAAIALAGMIATTAGASASARTTQDCRADSRQKVIDCCQQVSKVRRPLWMMGNGASCSSSAVCSTKSVQSNSITHVDRPKKVRVCMIVPKSDGGKNDQNPGHNTKGPNDPGNNNQDPTHG
jgi:hypothetical protein